MFSFHTRVCLLTASLLTGLISAQPLQQAALVPGADMILTVQMSALNQSPFMQALNAAQSPRIQALKTRQQAQIQNAIGLKEEDVLAYMLSMKLPEALFETAFEPTPEILQTLQFVLAVELATPLTLDKLKEGVELLREDTPGNAEVDTVELGGQTVLQLSTTTEAGDTPFDNAYISLSDSGTIVLLTLNEASLTAAHRRLDRRESATPGAELQAALNALDGNQIRMALLLPASARRSLAASVQQMSAADPMMGMFTAPFAGLSSITFSGNATDRLAMALNIDIGNDMAAQQLAAMARNFGPSLGGAAGPVARKITPEAIGTVLRLSGWVSPEDLRPLNLQMDLDSLE